MWTNACGHWGEFDGKAAEALLVWTFSMHEIVAQKAVTAAVEFVVDDTDLGNIRQRHSSLLFPYSIRSAQSHTSSQDLSNSHNLRAFNEPTKSEKERIARQVGRMSRKGLSSTPIPAPPWNAHRREEPCKPPDDDGPTKRKNNKKVASSGTSSKIFIASASIRFSAKQKATNIENEESDDEEDLVKKYDEEIESLAEYSNGEDNLDVEAKEEGDDDLEALKEFPKAQILEGNSGRSHFSLEITSAEFYLSLSL